jgi:ATP-binding cassette, subfamily B, bacterial
MTMPQSEPRGGLFDLSARFPALARLGRSIGAHRVPVIEQFCATECGAASLAMVLGYHGKRVTVSDVRESLGIARDGADALTLIDAARGWGLHGRGVKIDVDALEHLPPASILHWDFAHFVVFERIGPRGVEIVDPACGRRVVPMDRVRRSFTGVALLFEPTERFQPGKKGSNHVWRFARQVLTDRALLGRIVVTSAMLEMFALAGPLLLRAVTDQVLPQKDIGLMLVLSAGMFALMGFQLLANLVRSHLFLHLSTHLNLRIAFGFIDHLTSLPYPFFQARPAGDLMMRLNSSETIRDMLTSTVLTTAVDGGLVLVHLAILVSTSRAYAGVVLVLAGAQLLLYLIARRKQRDLQAEYLQRMARTHSYEVELFSGIESVKAMGCEERVVQRWSDLFVDMTNTTLAQGRLSAGFDSTAALFGTANGLVPLLFGTHLVLTGELSLGSMLALNAIAFGFLMPLAKLMEAAMRFSQLEVYVERINDVLDAPREETEIKRQLPRLEGHIALHRVSFAYSTNTPAVVRDVSLEIGAGQFVAIVGRSGAGKSTLAHLLLGLYTPTSGAIEFDGYNLADVDVRSVRRQVGIVTQSHELFGTTIRENIALADPSAPLDDVIRAAKIAQIHDDIIAMPMGYNTPIVSRGSISGGQKQRLALARALVRRPSILLLDEATSALDGATEQRVERALQDLSATRIVIAHRLSTVVNADLIVVMEAGTIAEVGTHESLLRRRGIYAELVAAQTGPAVAGRLGSERLRPAVGRLAIPSRVARVANGGEG